MKTDRSLAAFAGQFVPLKLTTGGGEWSQWSRKYPHDGRSIPVLFVIRADGKKLYGRSGMLSGSALPTMLLATLAESGRRFSDAEIQLLETHVPAAAKAIEQGDAAATGQAFAKLIKIGKPGRLNSFAQIAIQADELAAKFVEQTQKQIEVAAKALEDENTPAKASKEKFESIAYLASVKDASGPFLELSNNAAKALKAVKGNPPLELMLAQAEALQRARRYAASETANVKRKAEDAYDRVIQRHPDSEAARIAAAEKAALAGKSEPTPASDVAKTPAKPEQPMEGFRQWSDMTGKFKVVAKLVAVKEGAITLENKEGKKIEVPLKQLSDADKRFVLAQFEDF